MGSHLATHVSLWRHSRTFRCWPGLHGRVDSGSSQPIPENCHQLTNAWKETERVIRRAKSHGKEFTQRIWQLRHISYFVLPVRRRAPSGLPFPKQFVLGLPSTVYSVIPPISSTIAGLFRFTPCDFHLTVVAVVVCDGLTSTKGEFAAVVSRFSD